MAESEDLVAELLATHALGRLAPPLAAIVAAHVELSPAAARAFAGFEALAGRRLEGAAPMPIATRDPMLEKILATERSTAMPPAVDKPSGGLPRPLAELVAAAPNRWRFAWFGVRRRPLGRFGTFTLEMIRIAGRRPIPGHGHRGLEATLVLEGGFSDAGVSYGPGDLAVADAETEHRPVADPEGCLCVAAVEGAGIRLVNPFRRWR
jgi:putative transcriptional regulator